MHDCNDKNAVELINVEHCVGEYVREVSADREIKRSEPLWLLADVANEAFDLVVEPAA